MLHIILFRPREAHVLTSIVQIVLFHFESNSYRRSQKSPVVSTC